MKFLPVILAVATAALINVAEAKLDKAKKEQMTKECKEETKASDSDIELAHKHEIPESHEGKCFIACGFRKVGVVKDGKMNLEGANAFFEKALEDPAKRDQAIKVTSGCFASEDTKGLDECEAAAKYMTCIQKHPDFVDIIPELGV